MTVSDAADDPIVCRCLRITEGELLAALTGPEGFAIRSVRDLQVATGAGGGCTACHEVLRRYLTVHDRVSCATADRDTDSCHP